MCSLSTGIIFSSWGQSISCSQTSTPSLFQSKTQKANHSKPKPTNHEATIPAQGPLNGKFIGHAKSLNYTWGFLENAYLPKCDGKITLYFFLDLPQKNVIFIRRCLRNSSRTTLALVDSKINLYFGDWSSHNLQLLPTIFFISFMANIQKGKINGICWIVFETVYFKIDNVFIP